MSRQDRKKPPAHRTNQIAGFGVFPPLTNLEKNKLEHDPPLPCSLEVLSLTPDDLVITKITMCKSFKYQPLFLSSLIVKRQRESLRSPCCSSRFQVFLKWKTQGTTQDKILLVTIFNVYGLLTCWSISFCACSSSALISASSMAFLVSCSLSKAYVQQK